MAIPVFPPAKEAGLFAWSNNWSTKITATPTAYGLTAPIAVAYAALNATWSSAYTTATNPATNSKANIIAKNTAKAALLDGPGGARQLVAIVQAFPGTTDFMRGELNIRVRDAEPTPIPAPSTSPDIDIVSTVGCTIKVRVHESTLSIPKGKPAGAKGATVLWAIGVSAPTDTNAWTFSGNITKNVYDIELPTTTPAGSRVWVTAFWFNNRMESGPIASPVSVNVPGLGLLAA